MITWEPNSSTVSPSTSTAPADAVRAAAADPSLSATVDTDKMPHAGSSRASGTRSRRTSRDRLKGRSPNPASFRATGTSLDVDHARGALRTPSRSAQWSAPRTRGQGAGASSTTLGSLAAPASPPRPRGQGVGASLARSVARGLLERHVPDLVVLDDTAAGRTHHATTAGSVHPGAASGADMVDRGATQVCDLPVVVVHDARAYGAVLRGGSVGLGQSYMAGWWDADDLTATVRALLRAGTGYRQLLDAAGRVLAPALDLVGRANPPKPSDDRVNVRAHYDLPDQIFAAMLDETMAYSCAVFDGPGTSLADAQRAKFDRLCRKLRLGPHDHVIEIGSGWGGFAIHAASTYGCRVTTTTVSERQLVGCKERVARMGLTEQVTVLAEDYRDLRGRFDALVSIEMVEAVDWRLHHTFLRTCRRLLHDDGRMGLQAIVIDDASEPRARHHADFIRAMVFPGSCIPSVSRLVTLAARTGLRTLDVDDIGDHYPATLRHWRHNLLDAIEHRSVSMAIPNDGIGGSRWSIGDPRTTIKDRYAATATSQPSADHSSRSDTVLGEPWYRLWMLYLAYCEAAFAERHVSDVQMVLTPGRWRQTPTNRAMEVA